MDAPRALLSRRPALPADNAEARAALYAGEVFLTPPTRASLALADEVSGLLEDALGPAPRLAQHRLSDADFFQRIGAARRTLFTDERFIAATREVAVSAGFDPSEFAFDPVRLRTVLDGGDREPRARAVYYPHRDIWYGHPASLIVWWIPLDALAPDETFVLYPDRLDVPVPNDSEVFDYDAWVAAGYDLRIGWQDRESGLTARYPGVVGDVDPGRAIGFGCERADNLVFAGAHFHRTLPQRSGRTRFSLDFRVVHLGDLAAGRGAPSVDDRSRGCAVPHYVQPEARG
ncbi:MAG: hypothetical protein R3F49_12620 [Planctomycetota bacterium]